MHWEALFGSVTFISIMPQSGMSNFGEIDTGNKPRYILFIKNRIMIGLWDHPDDDSQGDSKSLRLI